VAGLQIELVLALLLHDAQVRSQRCFSDRLGIIVIVLLSLHERFNVDRRDDPRLMSQRAEYSADEVRAQAGFHTNNARWQLLKRVFETQSPDLPSEGNLPVDAGPSRPGRVERREQWHPWWSRRRRVEHLSLLWRPHDHHRDLRKGLPAETPPRAHYSSNQDRHLIMPSPPIHQPSDARHFGWLGQHSRRFSQVDISARNDTANTVRQRPLHSFGPLPTPILRGKAIGAGALTNLAQPDAAAKSP
jgi:hypothetical protein